MLGLGIGLVVLGVVLFTAGAVSQVLRLRRSAGVFGEWVAGDPERGLDQLKTAANKAANSWSAGSLVTTALLVIGGAGSGLVGVVLVAVALVRG